MNNFEQIRNELHFMLRQADTDIIPRRVPMTPKLIAITDEKTAQLIYDQIIEELEQESGIKMERL